MTKENNELTVISEKMAAAVANAGASVVSVDARRRFPASGIAFGPDLILTADHVVERDEDIGVALPDGTMLSATVAGRDSGSDLAVLRLGKKTANPFEPAKSEALVGQLVMALGRPTSSGIQASLGIISAIGGEVHTRRGGLLEGHIRTDATPYPGFSGGPLINVAGKVLGINTSGLGMGQSLAIPIASTLKIAEMLAEHGSIKRGFLGIRSQLMEIPEDAQKVLGRNQTTGLLLINIEEDSPAEKGSLKVGDILTGFNDRPVNDHSQLLGFLTGDVVGNPTKIEILRSGKKLELPVTVEEAEEYTRPSHSRSSHRFLKRRFSHHPPLHSQRTRRRRRP